jgi:hypothetical protein
MIDNEKKEAIHMIKPNFFIIGAPKCGTTSMYEWLERNPYIKMSTYKEPHFFSTDLDAAKNRSLTDYQQLFKGANEHHIAVGEGSTNYLYSQVAVTNILNYCPTAKFIVMLRNPIEMVYSLHQQEVFNLYENIKDFETAWHVQEKRRESQYQVSKITDYRKLLYGNRCKLGAQLERLYAQVNKEQVLVILLDDVKKNAREQYLKVLQFLGVPDDQRTDFPISNEAKVPKYAILSWIVLLIRYLEKLHLKPRLGIGIVKKIKSFNKKKQIREPLSEKMKEELKQYFRSDIEKLSELIDRDLSAWVR